MCNCWFTTSFNAFLLEFQLKYIPGDVYTNFAIGAAAEVLAHFACSLTFARIGPKCTFVIGFSLATIGGLLLALVEASDVFTPIVVCVSKFGICLALCGCYVSTPYLFSTIICSTAFGVCNCFGRFLSILAPIVAEVEGALPMLLFAGFSAFACITSLFIKTNVE